MHCCFQRIRRTIYITSPHRIPTTSLVKSGVKGCFVLPEQLEDFVDELIDHTLPVVDKSVLHDLVRRGELIDNLDAFIGNMPEWLSAIEEGAEHEDVFLVHNITLHILGAARKVGTVKIRQRAEALQSQARDERLDNIQAAYNKLEAAYFEAFNPLHAILTQAR